MKPWAKPFYNSKAWKLCRESYIANVLGGLCERCDKQLGHIVHHKKYLTPENINNPEISLNHGNLEYVCQDCHNGEHHGSSEPITMPGTAFDGNGNLIKFEEGFKRE